MSDAASAAAETPPTVDAVGKNAAVLSGPNSGEESTQTFQGTGNGSQPVSIPSVPGVGIPRSLRQWERFEVLEVLGAGGMGAVYKVRDPRLSRLVALKIVHPMLGHPDSSRAEIFIRRFVREARMQASLDHPHICKVYEIGELPTTDAEPGYPYIAMQLISGKPLHRAFAEMSLFEKVRVMKQVAEALHVAHRQGLVHRDIKPSNIMIERAADGKFHPYVMDFGLARDTTGAEHSRSGVIEGTPRYMAPEQARGETKSIDRRTDVYALGVTLYEILAVCSPYEAASEMDILMAVLTAEPRPLHTVDANIPADLEAVTMKCLEKEPAARYDSAKELADDLGRYLDGEPVQARYIGLGQRLYRRARKHKPLIALGAALLASLIGLVGYGVRTRMQTLERERYAQKQAELAEKLGQEITKMEWLLRSARQLPLHDLTHEKELIRKRMGTLQAELSTYGALSKGLAHYALGRGHMALHEYKEALVELKRAAGAGYKGGELEYALGVVQGKQFEQAMYEARLSGGGEWAEKELLELKPRLLEPAIEALKRSRQVQVEAPGYLEALILYYQREYEEALKAAERTEREWPWMYEAGKLGGDIHLEKALMARDRGKEEEAKREFGEAVRKYEGAARVGPSDGEVYEGLAEAWVRQIEMEATRGQPTEKAYAAAVEASDKLEVAEPLSIAGSLKKGYAALMTMAMLGTGMSSSARVKQCWTATEAVLAKQPDNPYASDVAAGCYAFAADGAMGRGEDPEPLLRKALGLLEPAVKKSPHFLWGLNDLANIYAALGSYAELHGHANAKALQEKSLEYESKAVALDGSYLTGMQNLISIWGKLVPLARSEQELLSIVSRAEQDFVKCAALNSKFQPCHVNMLILYARAAARFSQSGQDPRPYLQHAIEYLASSRKLGEDFLDLEQHAALAYYVDAADRVKHKADPGPALAELQAGLTRCLGINAQDAMCRTLAAQAEWVAAEYAGLQHKAVVPALKSAVSKAEEAVKSPESYPEAWQVLGESELRLARAEGNAGVARIEAVRKGIEAVERGLGINPNHALGLVTKAELEEELSGNSQGVEGTKGSAEAAVEALEHAVRSDPLLTEAVAPKLARARALLRSP